jgi:hypothetical protein
MKSKNRFHPEVAFGPPPISNGVEVKEVARHRKELALYSLIFPDHTSWRIARPIRHRTEIPTTLLPEFRSEHEARRTWVKLVGWKH